VFDGLEHAALVEVERDRALAARERERLDFARLEHRHVELVAEVGRVHVLAQLRLVLLFDLARVHAAAREMRLARREQPVRAAVRVRRDLAAFLGRRDF